MSKRRSRTRRQPRRSAGFQGEFIRYRCDCGRLFEIPDPVSNDAFPGVRLYFGACPDCGHALIHGAGNSGLTETNVAAAIDDFAKGFWSMVKQASGLNHPAPLGRFH